MTQQSSIGTTCAGGSPRAPGSIGACYTVTYNPSSVSSWAAVYWQYPTNNWGASPGLSIAEGATKVTFYAKATTPIQCNFTAGGISGNTYVDSFAATNNTTLTTAWAPYTIDSQYGFPPLSEGYNPVIGGFYWQCFAPGSTAQVQFWIDDIEYTQ
jgi:hypothetical protein